MSSPALADDSPDVRGENQQLYLGVEAVDMSSDNTLVGGVHLELFSLLDDGSQQELGDISSASDQATDISMLLSANTISYRMHITDVPNEYESINAYATLALQNGTLSLTDAQGFELVSLAPNTYVVRVPLEKKPAYAVAFTAIDSLVSNGSQALPLQGVRMQLLDERSAVIASWETTAKPYTVSLQSGTYTLEELDAPAGYELAPNLDFSVDSEGHVSAAIPTSILNEQTIQALSADAHNQNLVEFWEQVRLNPQYTQQVFNDAALVNASLLPKDSYDNADALVLAIINKPLVSEEIQVLSFGASDNALNSQAEYISIDVFKVWDDANDRDSLRPDAITVHVVPITAGIEGTSITLTAQNNWRGTIKDLMVVNEVGRAYEYSFEEVAVEGYTSTLEAINPDEHGYSTTLKITNTHTPVTVEPSTSPSSENNTQHEPTSPTQDPHASDDPLPISGDVASSLWYPLMVAGGILVCAALLIQKRKKNQS